MVNFILGPAGSGKSTLIYKRISDELALGKKVILLVPEQTAIIAESAVNLTAQSLNIPQTKLEVLNFKRLCNRIFREYGGIAYNSFSGGAKALIMWKSLLSALPFLKKYKNEIEEAKKFIPLLLSTISEFKSYNITPSMLSQASKEAEEDDIELSNKLSDLSIIFSMYENYQKQNYSDPSDDLTKASYLLSKNQFFKDTSVYIDSFSGFTPQEYTVISAIFRQSENITVSLCFSENRNSLAFEGTKETLKNLKKIALDKKIKTEETFLTGSFRYNSPELAFLEENLWQIGETKAFSNTSSDNIKLVISEGKYSEAEYVANDITAKIRTDNLRYRDFAIIARNIEDYKGIIDAILEQYNIPFHISLRAELRDKPLFKLLSSAFNVKNNGWNTDDVISYIKTALSPVSFEECDEIECYAYQWNIYGQLWYSENDWFMNPDGYTDVIDDEAFLLLKRINETRKKIVKPLVKLFESFDGTRKISELCVAVYTFFIDIEVNKKIAQTQDPDEIRGWNSFCSALDTMNDTIPDTIADATLFSNLFSLVIDQTNVGTLPSAIDEITIGSADNIRLNDTKHIYVLGVNEGIFPAPCSDTGIFSDSDKLILETYGLNLSPNSNIMSVNELFYFYTAVCSASESVTVICSSSSESGELLKPSSAFLRMNALFPKSKIILSEKLPLEQKIQNKEAAFPFAFLFSNTEAGKALEKIYINDPSYSAYFDKNREKLVSSSEKLDPKTVEKIFTRDISLTQSRLDKFVMCAFGYECTYVLSLKEKKKFEFHASETGNLTHLILERFFLEITDENGTMRQLSKDEKAKIIDRIINDFLLKVFGRDNFGKLTNRAIQLFVRLRRSVSVLIDNLIEEFSQSDFVPRFFEMKISTDNSANSVYPLTVNLPDGGRVFLYGIADRVDICKKGKDVYVRVVDYKTGNKDFSLYDISLGLNLQMLIYLFSIWKDQNGNFKKAVGVEGEILPAGILYCSAKVSDVSVKPDSCFEDVLHAVSSKLKRNGMLIDDEEILRSMEKKLSGKYIPITVKKDGTFSTSITLESLEGFGKLLETISETVSRIGHEIKTGEASPIPLKNGKHDGCKFCPHKNICRNPMAFESKI